MTQKLFVLLALLGLLGAACSSDTDVSAGDSTPASEAAPVDDGGGDAAEDEPAEAEGADAQSDSARDLGDGGAAALPAATYEEGTFGALLFADSAERAAALQSARFDAAIVVDGGPGSGMEGVEITMSGAFDGGSESIEMAMDLSGLLAADLAVGEVPAEFEAFYSDPMEMIVIGDEAWIKWGLLSMFTGVDDAWLAVGASEVSSATDSLGVGVSSSSPADMLAPLAGADSNLEDLGTETIRGVETQHWRVVVDLEALSEGATPAERAELEAQFGDLSVTEFPVEVWLGVDDGLLHRIWLEMDADAAGSTGTVAITFDLYDYGTDIVIEAPPADEVVDGEGLLAGF